MQKSPHMLIEGIVIAAYAGEIDRAFIYIRGEYELQAEILEAAIAEAARAGYLGENILDSGTNLSLVLHRGAGAYICGEETGLLDSLEGKRGNPRLKPPFPAIEGLYAGPTLINNVETLSTVPHIIAMGGDEYAKIGTETSTGTKLVSISGDVKRPGNYEIELGIPSREIIYGLAGGPPSGREVKFWFPGGSSSPVLTKDDLDVPYDFDSMAKAGSMLGSGAIIVADESRRVLDTTLKLAKFYAHESCGKCVPCREGTNWTVKMLQRIYAGEATPMDLDIMASVQEQIIGNCLCVLGDAMAMPIGSMVEKFRPELEAEIEAPASARRAALRATTSSPSASADEQRRARARSLASSAHATPPAQDDPADDRRPRGAGDRGRDAGRRRQAGRRRDPVLLLRAEARPAGRRVPHVPGRDRGDPEAADVVLDAGQGRDGRAHPDRARAPRPERGRRVPAGQPPARLPGVRQGRRVPAPGHHLRLGPRALADDRAQAPLPEAAGAVAADRDRPRALHPLLPLRALLAGDRRGLPADLRRARRAHVRGHPRRPPVRGAVQRQHRRAVPGRRADLAALPLPRPAVGHRGRRRHLHAVPVAVQRHLHRPRRPRRAGPGPRLRGQQGSRRRLAVRQGTLRLPGDPRRRADHRGRSSATPASCARSPGSARSRRLPVWPSHRGRVGALVGGPGDQRGGLPARSG